MLAFSDPLNGFYTLSSSNWKYSGALLHFEQRSMYRANAEVKSQARATGFVSGKGDCPEGTGETLVTRTKGRKKLEIVG